MVYRQLAIDVSCAYYIVFVKEMLQHSAYCRCDLSVALFSEVLLPVIMVWRAHRGDVCHSRRICAHSGKSLDIRRAVNTSLIAVAIAGGIGAASSLVVLGISGSVWQSLLVMVGVGCFIGCLVSVEFAVYVLLLLGLVEGIYKTLAPSFFTLVIKDAVLLLVLFRVVYISLRANDWSWLKQRITVPVTLFVGYLCAMAAAPTTTSLSLALAGFRTWVLWMPIYYPVYIFFNSREKVLRLLHTICFLVIPIAGYGLYQDAMGYEHLQAVERLYEYTKWYEGRATSILNSPALFGNFCAVSVLLSVSLAMYHKKFIYRVFFVAVAALAGGGLAASGTRGAALGLATGLLAFLLISRRKAFLVSVTVVVAVLSVGYILPTFTEKNTTIGPVYDENGQIVDYNMYEEASEAGNDEEMTFDQFGGAERIREGISAQTVFRRVLMPFQRALKQLQQRPLGWGIASGVGAGRIYADLREESRRKSGGYEWIENELGRAMTELGIPGTFFWVWMLWLATRTTIRSARSARDDREHVILGAMVSVQFVTLSQLLIGAALYDAAFGIYFWIFAAIAARSLHDGEMLSTQQEANEVTIA